MRRLLPAALIAMVLHGLIFLLHPLSTSTPPRLKAARRPVNLNLAHFVPAAPKVLKQPSKPKPNPPEPKPTPAPPKPKLTRPVVKKPTPKPKPRPKPEQPKPPEPKPIVEEKTVTEVAPTVPEATPEKVATEAVVAEQVAAVVDPGPAQEAPLVEATPLYAENPPPKYPRSARRRGRQGTVLLSVHVDTQGRVDNLTVKSSSGFTVLDKAALAAVRSWRFEAGRRGDAPVPMWVEVPIEFKLQ